MKTMTYDVFGTDCWNQNPKFTYEEQARINQIKAEERNRGCKVNN